MSYILFHYKGAQHQKAVCGPELLAIPGANLNPRTNNKTVQHIQKKRYTKEDQVIIWQDLVKN